MSSEVSLRTVSSLTLKRVDRASWRALVELQVDAIPPLKPKFALLGFVLPWLLDILELRSQFRESMGGFFFFYIMKQSERMESDLIKPISNFPPLERQCYFSGEQGCYEVLGSTLSFWLCYLFVGLR